MVEAFFEVFQAGIEDLFDGEHLCAEDVLCVRNRMIDFVETGTNSAI